MTDFTDETPFDDPRLDGIGDRNPGHGGNGSDPDAGIGEWPYDELDDEPTLGGIEDLYDEPTLGGMENLDDEPGLDPEIQIRTETPIHLHLAPTRGYRPGGPLWILARTMGLPVWGSDFLSRRASLEMQAGAGLLLILFCFELVAWSLLFNCMVHGANFTFSPYTSLAVVIAWFFASAVFLFERGVIVADFSVEFPRKVLGVGIRILVIGVSAIACSQPLELVLFDRSIDWVLYMEEVNRIATQEYEDYLAAVEMATPATTAEIETEVAQTEAHGEWERVKQSQEDAALQVHQVSAELERARGDRAKHEGTLSYWRSQVGAAQSNLAADPGNPALAAALDHAQRNRSWANQQLSKARQRVDDLSAELTKARSEQTYWDERTTGAWSQRDAARTEVTDRLGKGAEGGQADLDAIKDRIDVLLAGSPDDPPVDPATGAEFVWSNAGFTDRLSVVQDLIHGRPARWPATAPEVRDQVVEVFGLPDPAEEGLGAERTASTYMKHYIVAFLVALAIPLLSIAFKIIMPREFRNYLQTDWQALAGNPEAVRELLAQPGGREHLARLQGHRAVHDGGRSAWGDLG